MDLDQRRVFRQKVTKGKEGKKAFTGKVLTGDLGANDSPVAVWPDGDRDWYGLGTVFFCSLLGRREGFVGFY